MSAPGSIELLAHEADLLTPGPTLRLLWLELTEACNLTCTHCYSDSGPQRELVGSMRLADWERVIREAETLGCQSICFIGGEPLLYPGAMSLVGLASSWCPSVEIYSNLTAVPASFADQAAELRIRVATSVYSDDPGVHDGITGRKGSWQRTLATLHELRRLSVPLRIGFVEMAQNQRHAARVRALAESLGIEHVSEDRERGVGRGAKASGARGCDSGAEQLCGRCHMSSLCVTASGDCYPCVFARNHPIGSIGKGLAPLLSGARIASTRRWLEEEFTRPDRTEPMACDPWDKDPLPPAPDPPPLPTPEPYPPCAPDAQPGPHGPH